MVKKNLKSFEDKLNRLNEISELLEDENIGLEESINLYEEGILLSKECYAILKNAELKVRELQKSIEDELQTDEE